MTFDVRPFLCDGPKCSKGTASHPGVAWLTLARDLTEWGDSLALYFIRAQEVIDSGI